jgi:hypothetical protein
MRLNNGNLSGQKEISQVRKKSLRSERNLLGQKEISQVRKKSLRSGRNLSGQEGGPCPRLLVRCKFDLLVNTSRIAGRSGDRVHLPDLRGFLLLGSSEELVGSSQEPWGSSNQPDGSPYQRLGSDEPRGSSRDQPVGTRIQIVRSVHQFN